LPGTWYSYAYFSLDGEGEVISRSRVGRVRTALAPGALETLRVAATSCTNQTYMPYEALEEMAAWQPDVFLHTGDQNYNNGEESLAGFRNQWFGAIDDPGYRAIHETTGVYQTLDDHEVDDNFDPERIDPSILRNAFQAYFESFPVDEGPDGEIWTSYEWGATAEFFILDCRSERGFPDDSYYISDQQMDWLLEELSNSEAHFKVILNSVPITDMPTLYVATGDRWEGYDRQRDQLLDHITDNDIRNVWFISGDFHIGMVARIDNEGPARRIIEVAAGPGGNINPIASTLGTLEGLAGVDQFLFHTGSGDNEVQTYLTFDPVRDEVRVQFIDEDDNVLYDEWVAEGD